VAEAKALRDYRDDRHQGQCRRRTVQPQWSAVARSAATLHPSETISSIGSEMTVVGKIICKGILKLYGLVEGELNAPQTAQSANRTNLADWFIFSEHAVLLFRRRNQMIKIFQRVVPLSDR